MNERKVWSTCKSLLGYLLGALVLLMITACPQPGEPIVIGPATANTFLSSLSVAEGAISPAFNKNIFSYQLNVDSTVTTVTLTATAEASAATVTTMGPTSLAVGSNLYVIQVSNGDSARVYFLTVNRSQQVASTNANLASISVSSGALSPSFSSSVTSYSVNVANSVASIELTATVAATGATVTGTGTKNLNVGANTFVLTVTAPNGTSTKNYTVVVNRASPVASSNNNLSALSLSHGTLAPTFSSAITAYTATVPHTVSQLTITATAQDPTAVVTGAGSRNLVVGANVITVTVTAQNGAAQNYTITITRQEQQGTGTGGVDIGITPVPGVITITFSGVQQTLQQGSTKTVTATTSETVTSREWYLNGVLQATTGNSISLGAGLAPGSYRVDLQVRAGNRLASNHFTFTVGAVQTVATPVLSVASGAVAAGTTVNFTSSTTGVTFHFTLDGTVPTTSSPSGTSVVINTAATLSVIAVRSGMANSAVATATYTIQVAPPAVNIYFRHTGSTAPTIWIWELNGRRISEIMGFTWDTQPSMTSVGNNWFKYTVTGYSSIVELRVIFNRNGTEVSRPGTTTGSVWFNGSWHTTQP